MEYLLHLSGGDSGRTIRLRETCHVINNHHTMGGQAAECSYYAREGGTYEIEPLGYENESPKEIGNDTPKSIETESFPSSVGML